MTDSRGEEEEEMECPDYCERCVRVATYRKYNEELRRDELLCKEHFRADVAVTAALLHGQPFGFSRADVQQLRGAAANSPGIGNAVHLRDIADRLEALLPPETK